MKIDAGNMDFKQLNDCINSSDDKEIEISNVRGQRYIGASLSGYTLTLEGTPGNALACYMNDSTIIVNGNAQDATGDTMNLGRVIVYGHCGDTCGYAMRGGEIYIRDSAGYRTGIHMKEYRDQSPVIVVGGTAGDFLGEYLAGGMIIVLGMGASGATVGKFCGTGIHGGVIYLRGGIVPPDLPAQVNVEGADANDINKIRAYVEKYCGYFGGRADKILNSDFLRLTPNSKNPYKQLYTNNW